MAAQEMEFVMGGVCCGQSYVDDVEHWATTRQAAGRRVDAPAGGGGSLRRAVIEKLKEWKRKVDHQEALANSTGLLLPELQKVTKTHTNPQSLICASARPDHGMDRRLYPV